MSKYDGITRSRNKVGEHNGFSIIKVIATHHWYNPFQHCYEMSKQYETKREVYYEFCKIGDENRPAQAYTPYPAVKKVEDIKICIDNFIKDDSIYFTEAERNKYVSAPNKKCDYGYGYDSLMKIMREHQKATKRIKILLEDRLTDANFHGEAGYLAEERYEEFEKMVTETYQFNEKFEIITNTKCKAINDPERLEAHIKAAIEEYFKEHKIDVGDTSVSVKFIKRENW